MIVTHYGFFKQLTELPFVEEIWLFGSRARGDQQERSDIDLAIVCPTATNADWRKVNNIIDEADTLLKIDCIWFDRLSDDDKIKRNILAFKKVLYKKK